MTDLAKLRKRSDDAELRHAKVASRDATVDLIDAHNDYISALEEEIQKLTLRCSEAEGARDRLSSDKVQLRNQVAELRSQNSRFQIEIYRLRSIKSPDPVTSTPKRHKVDDKTGDYQRDADVQQDGRDKESHDGQSDSQSNHGPHLTLKIPLKDSSESLIVELRQSW